ncbi:MAG: hypothetical protein ACHQ17_03180 [Polyangia bacterium]
MGAALLSALAIAGCGGDNSLFDLGTGGDAAAPLYKLHSGTYGVTAESSLVDGCMAFDATTAPFSSLTGITKVLANDGAGNISLGGPDANGTPTPAEPQEGASCPGSPANAACATATIQPPPQFDNNMGFLVSDYSLDDGQGCTIHRHVENVLTLTADDTFTAAYSVKDDQMTSGCTVETSACTTSFTWNWKKQ